MQELIPPRASNDTLIQIGRCADGNISRHTLMCNWSPWLSRRNLCGDAGYGFVSFSDPIEGAKALREMDGKYVGNRPCKLRKSTWDERIDQQQVNKKKRKGNPDGKPILNHKKHVGVLHR